MFARIVPLLVVLALTACSTSNPISEIATSTGRTDRIVLAPLNLALRAPAEIAGFEAPVWSALVDHFHSHDRAVRQIDAGDARELWASIVTEMGDARALDGATQTFARRLSDHSEYDLLVMPSLVMRRAAVRGRLAYWDGVRRRVDVVAPWDGAIEAIGPVGGVGTVSGLKGQIAAASLYVAVLTADGTQVYEGLGGLDLLQEVDHARDARRGEWSVVLRENPFASDRNLREGIDLALERQLPRTARAW